MANSRPLLLRIASALGIRAQRGHKMSPNERLKRLEVWSARATLLILVGILVEIWMLWAFPHEEAEIRWGMVANVAIAVGLIAEYIVIGRTISATDEANREMAWRTLSPEQIAALQTALPGENRCAVVITTLSGDVESRHFAEQFRAPLLRAGWEVVSSLAATAQDVGFGIRVPAKQGNASIHSDAVDPLRKGLTSAGIEFDPGDLPGWSMEIWGATVNAPLKACLFIGPKPILA